MSKRWVVMVAAILAICGTLRADLVSYWPLDEGTGQLVNDLSGNGYSAFLGDSDAAEAADPAWVIDPVRGPVLEWTGNAEPEWINLDAYVDDFSVLSQGTIMAWVKLPGGQDPDVILAASNSAVGSTEIRFFYDGSYQSIPGIRYDVRIETDTYFQLSSYPTNPRGDTWRHVAVTVAADGTVGLYVDGVLRTTGQEVGFFSAVPGLNTMSIGRNIDNTQPSGIQWPFYGRMSDLAVFDTPLPDAAIRAVREGLDILSVPTAVYAGTPTVGSTHVDPATVLTWQPPLEVVPSAYHVYLGTDPNALGDPVYSGAATTYDPQGLDMATTYYWRVDAEDAEGAVYPGLSMYFTTAGLVESPVPVNGKEGVDPYNLELAWTGDEFIAAYDVYLGTSPESLAFQATVTEPRVLLADLDEFADYYWRVDTRDAESGLIAEGPVWTFSTGGLAAYWTVDSLLGGIAADAVGGADGTLQGEPNSVVGVIPDPNLPGAFGKAISLDGVDDYVDGGDQDHLEGLPGMTISLWAKPATTAGGARIIEHEDVFYFYRDGARYRFTVHGTSGNAASAYLIVPGNWNHVVATTDGVQTRLYVDGVLQATVASGPMPSSVHPLSIGARRSAGGPPDTNQFFAGAIDDVQIYSAALTAESIAALYARSSLAMEPAPEGGAIDIPLETDLTWQAGAEVVNYDVYLQPDSLAGATPVAPELTDTLYDPGMLDLFTTYYWRVDSRDAFGQVLEGNVWSFRTVPPRAVSPTPADGAEEVHPDVELSWLPGGIGAFTYDVYLGTNVDDLQLIAGAHDGTSFDPGMLEWATTYYWKVDQRQNDDVFEGLVWTFTTIVPLCDPPLPGDVDGDCIVNLADLAIMAMEWMQCNRIPADACP